MPSFASGISSQRWAGKTEKHSGKGIASRVAPNRINVSFCLHLICCPVGPPPPPSSGLQLGCPLPFGLLADGKV